MKKNKTLVILLITICSINGMAQIQKNFSFSLSNLYVKDTLGADNILYSYISLGNILNCSSPLGFPELPIKYIDFLIPTGSAFDSIHIDSTSYTEIIISHKVSPIQNQITACIGCPPPAFIVPDSLIYNSPNSYPLTNIELKSQKYWNNANIITIALNPIQYFPLQNKIKFLTQIKFTIYYRNIGYIPSTINMLTNRFLAFNKTLIAAIQNPEDINTYLTGIVQINKLPTNTHGLPNYDFIIIAPNSFITNTDSKLNEFVLWKNKRGINTGILTKEQISAAYVNIDDNIGNTGPIINNVSILGNNEPAVAIRMFLKDAYSDGGASYVLLVGDDNTIPILKIKSLSNEILTKPPTDKYFGDFDSDFAVDNDTDYGEYRVNGQGDNVGFSPSAYVGRIPCANVTQMNTFIDKLLLYEQDPGKGDPNYLSAYHTMRADQFQNNPNNPFILTNLSFYTTQKIWEEKPSYFDPSPTEPYGSSIIAGLNNSPAGFWSWLVHGENIKVSTMTYGDNSSIKSSIDNTSASNGILYLNNFNKPGMVYSASCSVAAYQSTDQLCLAEACLFNINGGGVSFSGNTEVSWISNEMLKLRKLSANMKLCNDSHFDYLTHLGISEINSFAALTGSDNHDTYLIHNFFGDPEMRFYTKVPNRIKATYTQHSLPGQVVTVSISNINIYDTVYVSLFMPKGLDQTTDYQKCTIVTGTHSSVNVSITLPTNLSSGKLFCTISGFNYLPFTSEIIVTNSCVKSSSDEIIATTPQFPWTDLKFKNGNVIVKNGATLTIKGEVYFVPDAKLIVEQGGSLIIDGGKLSTSCEALWKGVEVWGQYNMPQATPYQGVVKVINNGSICDAVYAVRAVKFSGINYDPTTTGGIITCDNAHFINNKYAIALYPYQYLNWNYNSSISNCEFIIDDKYLMLSGKPQNMLELRSIKGITVRGCNFTNLLSETTAIRDRGTAVYAYDAGISVDQKCTSVDLNGNCLAYKPCKFDGWYYAVKALGIGNVKSIWVYHSQFSNNLRGIYLSATTAPALNLNEFILRNGSTIDTASGIYLNSCTGYSVQENSFSGHYNGGALTYETGIVINNSGTTPNEIYNNTFTKLQNGILAQNKNRDATGEYGLTVKCNDFFSPNKYDIAVTKDNTNSGNGIKRIQGVDGSQTTDPAGNTFSYTHQNSESDYHNECENITYIYHAVANGFNVNPVNHTSQPVVSTIATTSYQYSYSKSGSCPSHLDNGGGGISQLKLQQDGMESIISNYTGQMMTFKDGGNTAELKEDIAYSIPPEALSLYNSLLSKSPYLSDSVMVEAIGKEEVLPTALVTDILVANPQSAKSSEVNEALDSRTNLLSDEQREDVDQGVFVLSAFETLQSKLDDALAQRAQVQNAIINHYLSDSTDNDSLKVYLAAQPDQWAKQLLLMQYLAEMDTTAADALLQSITFSSLITSQQAEWSDLTTYYSIHKQITAQANNAPDSLQQIILTDLATHNTHGAAYARNLLVNQSIVEYHEPYIFPDDNLKSSEVIRRKQVFEKSDVVLKVFPNPAADYIIAEYQFNESKNKQSLNIIDVLGRIRHSVTLTSPKGYEVIPIVNMSPGIYTITLTTDDRIVKEAKIVVSQ